ncbi:MAG: hypothetical protein OXN86_07870 [Chloroflexota bacterium]|nr:hypothetical protein [Chloroflexota bacterium]
MRTIELREYEPSDAVALSVAERDALAAAIPSLRITPAAGARDAYVLTPASVVGALELGGLSIRIRPKLPIQRVLYLASQAINRVDFRDEPFGFDEAATPQHILVPAFIAAAQRAFSGGLLHGYRSVQDSLTTVRGRIDFAEQFRRRYDLPLPVEVRYDDFTEDVLSNRLVRAAARRLAGMNLQTPRWHQSLRLIDATLANVTLIRVPCRQVPSVQFDRLNDHYREVVELSRLILRHTVLDAVRGEVRASGFLMDMNVVFQEFVTNALRRQLDLSERNFRSDAGCAAAYLDKDRRIALRPDFTWWEGGRCVFAGDAKYKIIEDGSATNADLYQALAYASALDLPGALLAYAEGWGASYDLSHSDKRLEVETVNLDGSIEAMEASVARLASRCCQLRSQSAHHWRHPA